MAYAKLNNQASERQPFIYGLQTINSVAKLTLNITMYT